MFYSKESIVAVGSHSGKLAVVDLYSGKERFAITLPDRIESSLYPSPCGKYGVIGNSFVTVLLYFYFYVTL